MKSKRVCEISCLTQQDTCLNTNWHILTKWAKWLTNITGRHRLIIINRSSSLSDQPTQVRWSTTSQASPSCRSPHWRRWWRASSTGCLSSGTFERLKGKNHFRIILESFWDLFPFSSGTVEHDGALFVPFAKPLLKVVLIVAWNSRASLTVIFFSWDTT